MRQAIAALTLLAAALAPAAAAGQALSRVRARDLVPADGLVASSVAAVRDQAALNAHYYLADETALGLGPETDAVVAAYRTKGGDALLLIAVYPSAEEAGRAYGRFGGDFFSENFDPMSPLVVEAIETGDWAGAARRGPVLAVVLEAADRAACDSLLRRILEKVPALEARWAGPIPLREVIRMSDEAAIKPKFPATFWTANTIELFERAA